MLNTSKNTLQIPKIDDSLFIPTAEELKFLPTVEQWKSIKGVSHDGYLDYSAETFEERLHSWSGMWELRQKYQTHVSFAIISQELIHALKPWCQGNVVEIGAGSGWLSAHLQRIGVPVVPYDNKSWRWGKHFTEVKTVDNLDCVKDADTVIMSWPNYSTSFAFDVATAMKPGASLIYCGERDGGCTGDDSFFELINSQWVTAFSQTIDPVSLCFDGVHDYWQLWVKPNTPTKT